MEALRLQATLRRVEGVRRRRTTMLIAAIVVAMAGPSFADTDSIPHVVWGPSGATTPKYSSWSGSAWSSGANTIDIGGAVVWIAGANCPTRDEFGFIASDLNSDINAYGRWGSTWTPTLEITSDCGGTSTRMFDFAYEQTSGDALIVYWDQSASRLYYRTSNGYSMSGASTVSTTKLTQVKWVRLSSKSNSNEIIAAWMHSDRSIYAKVWNGSSWGNEIAITANAYNADRQCFDIAYESKSGDAMVAYCDDDSTSPLYRIWNGSSWSAEDTMSNVGAYGYYLRLVSDPLSDCILCAVQDSDNDLNVQLWRGASWQNGSQLETNLNRNDTRQFDIAFENGGAEALIVYASDMSSSFRYRTWDGDDWSSEFSDIDVGDDQIVIQLATGAIPGQVFVQMAIDNGPLRSYLWNGSSFTASSVLETTLSSWTREPFVTVVPGALPIPASVPYSTDFESGVGREWNTAATDNDADFSTFLGRFNGQLVQLQLNTTVGETYQIKFDLYTLDSWNPNSSNLNSDYFKVDVNGTNVLLETLSNRPSDYPASYPNPADLLGALGFGSRTSTDDDGIYRNVTVAFTATSSVSTIVFSDGLDEQGNSKLSDESWGIDNVSVTTSRFRDVSVAKGFNVQSTTDEEYASGIYFADFDNDGDLDVILGGNSSSRYMKNNSQGASFTASTFGTGNERRGAALFDCDNDGDVDFWSGNHNSYYVETCFQNNGSGTFSDIGNLGYGDPNNNEGVAAADVDRDGWCDIVHFSENANWIGEHQGDPGGSLPKLTGSNASSKGLNDSGDVGNGDYASSGDFNNDGYLDFFYHYATGKLFASDGDGTYTENARGISVYTSGSEKMGSVWGDYDNDGDLDLFVARYASGSNGYLWRNDVTWSPTVSGTFTDQATAAYVKDTSGQRGCAWGDYDNDGDLDLYVVTRSGPNRLYQNQNDGTFRLVHEGADIDGDGHDAVFVDYDNDGDLDIAYTREDTTHVLLENRTNDSNYLKVRVIGVGGGGTNVAAIGVRIELWNADGTIRLGRRDVGVARGYGGTEPLWAHFGGVDAATTYKLKTWFHSRDNSDPLEVSVVPNSVSTTIGSVTISQMITVQESEVRKKILFWREVPNRS